MSTHAREKPVRFRICITGMPTMTNQKTRPTMMNAPFDLAAEMADQPLYGPGRRIAERADRVTFDLARHVEQ